MASLNWGMGKQLDEPLRIDAWGSNECETSLSDRPWLIARIALGDGAAQGAMVPWAEVPILALPS